MEFVVVHSYYFYRPIRLCRVLLLSHSSPVRDIHTRVKMQHGIYRSTEMTLIRGMRELIYSNIKFTLIFFKIKQL